MDICCLLLCVLSGRGLCDELITRPEESYRLWRVVVCDQETSCDEEAIARAGLQCQRWWWLLLLLLLLFKVVVIDRIYFRCNTALHEYLIPTSDQAEITQVWNTWSLASRPPARCHHSSVAVAFTFVKSLSGAVCPFIPYSRDTEWVSGRRFYCGYLQSFQLLQWATAASFRLISHVPFTKHFMSILRSPSDEQKDPLEGCSSWLHWLTPPQEFEKSIKKFRLVHFRPCTSRQ
jgi:hypothetical protein